MQAIDEYRDLAGQESIAEELGVETLKEHLLREREAELEQARKRAKAQYKDPACQDPGHPIHRPDTEPFVAPDEPGRNDPCSCGSGEKYKRCCLLAAKEVG